MSKPERREILSRVAAGTISPEEAAAQLDAINQGEGDQQTIQRVRIVKRLGAAEIIGDPDVRDAVAEGRHRARIEGDVMSIEGRTGDEPGSFITRTWFGFPEHMSGDRLIVILNPSLSLQLHLQAHRSPVPG